MESSKLSHNHTTELTITYQAGRKIIDDQARKLESFLKSKDLPERLVIHLKGLTKEQHDLLACFA